MITNRLATCIYKMSMELLLDWWILKFRINSKIDFDVKTL